LDVLVEVKGFSTLPSRRLLDIGRLLELADSVSQGVSNQKAVYLSRSVRLP